MIVQDPTVKQALAELNRAGVTDYIGPMIENPGSLPHQDQEKRTRMMKSVLWQMEHLHEIPALIIACMDFGVKVDAAMMAQGGGSIWPGIQNLLLGCKGLGPGRGANNPCAARSGSGGQSVKFARNDGRPFV